MRVLVVGDMHIKTSTLGTLEEAYQDLVDACINACPEYVVLLGDQLDGHGVVQTQCLEALTKLLESISKHSKVIMLVGNHDMLNNQQFCTDLHPFNAMKHMKGVTVVDAPLVVTPLDEENRPLACSPSFICTPFVPTGRFAEALDTHLSEDWKQWRTRKADAIVFAHQEFKGVQMSQVTSTKGDIYEEDWPMVISGHIHERQKLGNNVQYVGTPWKHSFTNECTKTTSLLDFGSESGCDPSSYVETRVELKGVMQKICLTCDAGDLGELDLEEGAMYKITVVGTEAELIGARQVADRLSKTSEAWRRTRLLCKRKRSGTLAGDAAAGEQASELTLGDIRSSGKGSTMHVLINMCKDRPELKCLLESICRDLGIN